MKGQDSKLTEGLGSRGKMQNLRVDDEKEEKC